MEKNKFRFGADKILDNSANIIRERGKTHGGEEQQERNMTKCVEIFEAITGIKLTPFQGWVFMMCLKLSRYFAGGDFHKDDLDDLIGYTALATEQAYNDHDVAMPNEEPSIDFDRALQGYRADLSIREEELF